MNSTESMMALPGMPTSTVILQASGSSISPTVYQSNGPFLWILFFTDNSVLSSGFRIRLNVITRAITDTTTIPDLPSTTMRTMTTTEAQSATATTTTVLLQTSSVATTTSVLQTTTSALQTTTSAVPTITSSDASLSQDLTQPSTLLQSTTMGVAIESTMQPSPTIDLFTSVVSSIEFNVQETTLMQPLTVSNPVSYSSLLKFHSIMWIGHHKGSTDSSHKLRYSRY